MSLEHACLWAYFITAALVLGLWYGAGEKPEYGDDGPHVKRVFGSLLWPASLLIWVGWAVGRQVRKASEDVKA